MTQVTLYSNEFIKSGNYEQYSYNALKIERFGNGRVYFTCINNGMRMIEMAKQMKLIDGKVIISFGKNDKLEIGTYTENIGEC